MGGTMGGTVVGGTSRVHSDITLALSSSGFILRACVHPGVIQREMEFREGKEGRRDG